MEFIPAIDIYRGRCVRLRQGERLQETVYADDPRVVAEIVADRGAKRLHLIDLDGAFAGAAHNFKLIKDIVEGVSVPVQVGGGIRTFEDAARVLEAGAARVILGTAAVTDPAL